MTVSDLPKLLVTGGAGYIGAHAAHALLDLGHEVVILDDLSTGFRRLLPPAAKLIEGRVQDQTLVEALLKDHDISAVLHFAGSIEVGESVENPLKYYANNTAGTRTLLAACVSAGVRNFIFSSTAAVYGTPEELPVTEGAVLKPINPYGWSKLMAEQIIRDTAAAHDLRFGILRYFNVAGAEAQGRAGQCSDAATHLIKIACQVATGKRQSITVFGDDYDTPDGTGVRDYIHISDLINAHVLLLRHLLDGGASATFNCGYGRGASVKQVLAAVDRLLNQPIARQTGPRRAGDPAELVANADRLREQLSWQPAHDNLDEIVASALAWERKLAKR